MQHPNKQLMLAILAAGGRVFVPDTLLEAPLDSMWLNLMKTSDPPGTEIQVMGDQQIRIRPSTETMLTTMAAVSTVNLGMNDQGFYLSCGFQGVLCKFVGPTLFDVAMAAFDVVTQLPTIIRYNMALDLEHYVTVWPVGNEFKAVVYKQSTYENASNPGSFETSVAKALTLAYQLGVPYVHV